MKKVILMCLMVQMFGLVNLSAQITRSQQDSIARRNQWVQDSVNRRNAWIQDSIRQRDIKMQGNKVNPPNTTIQPDLKMQKDNPMPTDDRMQRDDRRVVNDTIPPKQTNIGMDNKATDNKIVGQKPAVGMPNLTSWPAASRAAVEETISKYGQPDRISEDEMAWMNKGVWKKICITKRETKHSFPVEHTDMMESTINYKVPPGKMDDLGQFDGSITFDRTQGTMSARCDKEANNILALNLAHEIVTGKLTVRQARVAFANIAKEKMNGGNPNYMQKLLFTPASQNTADPDTSTAATMSKGEQMKSSAKKESTQ